MSTLIPKTTPGLQQPSEVRHHGMAATMSKSTSASDNKGRNWEDLVTSLSQSYNDKISQALQQHEYNFVLSDPRLPDHPIVYASDGFLKMSGYEQSEVLGRNCRFLQGPETDRRTVGEIRDAVREERPCQVRILNYRKDGKSFWNLFHMAPVFSKTDGRVIHFVGVQTPIASDLAADPSLMNDLTHEAERVSAKVHKARDEQANSKQVRREGGARESEEVADQELQSVDDGVSDVSLRIRGGAASKGAEEVGEEEDTCRIREADQIRASSAVSNVTRELTQLSKVTGALAQNRCIGLAESSANGVVCSSLMGSLARIQQSFVLADPNLPDVPIVHASDVFCQLTGYNREEVVGRNCRFLQGPGTDPEAVKQIREAIENKQSCTVRLLNYRKDKTPFWNHLHVAPVRSCCGKVAFYIGVQLDVSQAEAEEVQERGMSAHAKQLGAVGSVRVAVRSLQGLGLRRTPISPRPKSSK
uniref:Putative LOV domain-containing protein n=1 Tax=Atrichum angustatum TaxID=37310 RepID=A0A140F7Q2_9BRYO|nr:putative LOV domain-containing protein [Atrichum angustatum]